MPRLIPPVALPDILANMRQPRLEISEHLVLRPMTLDDAPVLLEAFATPDIQHWHMRTTESLTEAKELVEKSHTEWTAGTGANWLAIDPTKNSDVDGRPLGRVALHLTLAYGTVEVAYWVLPEGRGRGVASLGATAVAAWAFQNLGTQRAELEHSVENIPSCRVAEKAGFKLEGTRRHSVQHVDGWHDMHVHAKIADD